MATKGKKISPNPKQLSYFKLCASPDCGFFDQRPSRFKKLYLLSGAARLYKGHQHPPPLPPHQHPARSPYLKGPKRPHCHTQGETQTV